MGRFYSDLSMTKIGALQNMLLFRQGTGLTALPSRKQKNDVVREIQFGVQNLHIFLGTVSFGAKRVRQLEMILRFDLWSTFLFIEFIA